MKALDYKDFEITTDGRVYTIENLTNGELLTDDNGFYQFDTFHDCEILIAQYLWKI
jgi:hypothetical protein